MQDDELQPLRPRDQQAERRRARDRADRLGQVDDAVRGAERAQRRRTQHPHDRGPRRAAHRGRQADADRAQGGRHLRRRAALDAARRPRRDHGRRDPRPRDRAHRRRGGAHRPPRALDAAHARRAQRARPADRHGHRAVPRVLGDRLHRRPAPRADAVHALQAPAEGLRGGARRARPGRRRALRGGRLLALRRLGLSRPAGRCTR